MSQAQPRSRSSIKDADDPQPDLGADGNIVTARSSASAVHVEGVTKRFGVTVALAGVDLDVAEGTVFGLLGPNGAGKTTLVRVLATLLAPDAGRAEVLGHDVVHEAAAVRQLLGLTGQFAAVDEILTGRENLEMFGRLFDLSSGRGARPGRRVARALRARRRCRPPGAHVLGRDAPPARPRLEPAHARGSCSSTSRPPGLDPRSRNEIWAIVRELVREGTTILLTTQYLEEADQLADRIAVIDHGRVIAQGTGNELKDRVGGQILEVELTSAAQRDEARVRARRGGLRRSRTGRAPGPAHAARAARRPRADRGRRRRYVDAGIGVSDLGLRRPTLDDVFLQLTGAPPSEDGAGPASRARADAGGDGPASAATAAPGFPAGASSLAARAALGRRRRGSGHRGATCATSFASPSC